MDQAQPNPPTAQTPPAQNKSRTQSILHNRMVVIGLGIGVVIIVAAAISFFLMTKKPGTPQTSEKTFALSAKQKYLVTSVSNDKVELTNSKGKREIKNDKTTLVYQNLPPENKPAKFSDLKPQQEVDVLEIKPNTILYIIGGSTEQNITISKIEAKSAVPNRTLQISNPTSFKEQVQKAEWIYNTDPPQNISINLVSTPQDVIFIKGTSGNTISTSAAVDGQNAVISLYVNPAYIQTETPQLLSQFATAAVLSQIYSAMNPTQTTSEILSQVTPDNGGLTVQ